jgi:hypothetical protein
MGIWVMISNFRGWVTAVRPERCLLLPLFLGGVGACVDKATPDYVRCGQLESSGDLPGALAACEAASKADPGSFSGKSATARLTSITLKLAAKTAADDKAAADAAAAGAAERSRLVSSASPDDWRTLISKYPGTPEAQSAETKLRESGSVCANLQAWRLEIPLHRAETFGTELSTAKTAPGALEGLAPVSLHSIGDKALGDAKAVREALSRIQVHAAQPGEGDVQSSLVADYEQMAALDESWVQKLQASDVSVGSVADLVKRTDALAGKIMLNEAKRTDRCGALPAAAADGG